MLRSAKSSCTLGGSSLGLFIFVALAPLDTASANHVYRTNGPFGGPFGVIGFDVSSDQSVALRFTPQTNFTLDRVGVWFMNNDFSGKTHPPVNLTLRAHDRVGEIPSNIVIEQWEFSVTAVGWDPTLEQVDSKLHPVLEAGVDYWIVAESPAPGGLDPVWNWAALDSGFMSICNGNPCEWQPPGNGAGAVGAGIIQGTPVIHGDIDGNGEVDVDDLLDVITQWGPCPEPPTLCPADIAPAGKSDGAVDVDDLLLVITDWG